ncbi:hypothetical protein V8E36_006362 [Tilletia maclaganii]
MSRASSSRSRASAASEGGVGLGIAFAGSPPVRSPLRRRRSQTESEYTEGSNSRATSVGAGSSSLAIAARAGGAERSGNLLTGKQQSAPTHPAAAGAGSGLDANGLASAPPVKRGRGRPRKHPLPPGVLPGQVGKNSSNASVPKAPPPAPAQTRSLSTPAASTSQLDLASASASKSTGPRPSNGRAAASRLARASAAAELNRRAWAAQEQSSSSTSAGVSSPPGPGPNNTIDIDMEEVERALGPAASAEAAAIVAPAETAGPPGKEDAEELDAEAAEREAEEMASRWNEEYYEIVQQLPLELTRCFTLVRETEGKVQNHMEKIRKAAQAYYQARRNIHSWVELYAAKAGEPSQSTETAQASGSLNATSPRPPTPTIPVSPSAKGKERAHDASQSSPSRSTHSNGPLNPATASSSSSAGALGQLSALPMPMSLRQRVNLLTTISASIKEARRAADEKVELARTAYELVDRHMARLDADLARNQVGFALGLRVGTEESRGARKAHGALAMAQVGDSGDADATSNGAAADPSQSEVSSVQAEAAGSAAATSNSMDVEDTGSNTDRRPSADKKGTGSRTSRVGSLDKMSDQFDLSGSKPSLSRRMTSSQAGPSRARDAPASVASGSRAGSRRQSPSEVGDKAHTRSQRTVGDGSDVGPGSQQGKRRLTAEEAKMKGKSPVIGFGKEEGSSGGTGRKGVASGVVAAYVQPEDNGGDGPPSHADSSPVRAKTGQIDNGERWCYCQGISSGDMVYCDGEKCQVEWFHFDCVGLKEKPSGKWFCRFCKPNFKGAGHEVPPNAKIRPDFIPNGGTAAMPNPPGKG